MGWYLQAPDGSEIDLNTSPYYALVGKQGFVFPNVAYASTRSPFGGEVVSDRWLKGRRLVLPLRLELPSGAASYRGALNRLVSKVSVDPARPSWLIWRGAGGSARRLPVLLAPGSAWTDTTQQAGRTWTKVALNLYSPAAYWENSDEVSVPVSGVQGRAFLPYFPFALTASGVVGQVSVTVAGAGAYVRWSVRGSADHVLLQNQTTGEKMYFPDLVLYDNDNLTIIASPAAITQRVAITIYRNDGTSESGWKYLSSDSKVWFLDSGTNDILAQAIGTSSVTQFVLYYREYYLTPWSDDE